MAVDDALISYFERPSQFDPARSSLFTYLRIRAKSCLLNYLGRKKNTHQENKSVELDSPETVYEVEARNGQDAEITLIEHESQTKIMQRLREVVTDPVDFQLLSLMLEGVRETDAFAAVLGIAALPGSEQARLVKQHKDRIKKAVQRKLRR
jgi:hypothetical protein